jgi:sortase A
MAWVSIPRRHRSLRWSRWLFFAVALVLVGYVGFALADAKVFQAYENWQLERALNASVAANAAVPGGVGTAGTASRTAELRRTTYAVGSVIGRLQLPRIGVDAIIAEGIDAKTLRRSVGHVRGTALPGEPGNVAIAGHRDTFFRALEGVRVGDEITLSTAANSYRYRVDSVTIVSPDDVSVLRDPADAGATLTLVTCYPFYYVGAAPQRFIVRAHAL